MGLQHIITRYLTPQAGLAPVATAIVIPANPNRNYLIILNRNGRAISLGFGEDAVAGSGVVLDPESFFEMISGENLDTCAIHMITTINPQDVSWQEGIVRFD